MVVYVGEIKTARVVNNNANNNHLWPPPNLVFLFIMTVNESKQIEEGKAQHNYKSVALTHMFSQKSI